MLLKPDLIVDGVADVTPELLRSRGLRGVMVDLDDTLVPSGGDLMAPACRAWLSSLREAGVRVLVLSNGERGRVAQWCRELELEGLHLVGKPFGFAFRRGLHRLGTPARETAMIGDQLFTDVLGANLAGLTSILVRPLSPGVLPHTRAARTLERWVLGGDHGRSFDR